MVKTIGNHEELMNTIHDLEAKHSSLSNVDEFDDDLVACRVYFNKLPNHGNGKNKFIYIAFNRDGNEIDRSISQVGLVNKLQTMGIDYNVNHLQQDLNKKSLRSRFGYVKKIRIDA
ncbi:hypothetical protein [Fructilactobacillus fructivorans]|uniref:hypothetical protein n=1 Tax=Fructilactobacillus fructivorans TaxID=1614 RepID=UPI000704BD83|nr:hypothetical protein [Fructilactobacillus fructivorans]